MSEQETYKIFTDISNVDISESDIWAFSPDVLEALLIDHSVSNHHRRERYRALKSELGGAEPSDEQMKEIFSIKRNITWATHDYEERGEGYDYHDAITPANIIGENGRVVMPRVLKDASLQVARSKDKAEVFTPSWMCNAQNNLIDEAWFGRNDVFNREVTNPDGSHSWITTEGNVVFPEGDRNRTWKKYITDNRMEITCGEAPYLVSRYDTTTGEPIPIEQRIGLLDRKLRIVSENCHTSGEWLKMAQQAYKHTYGYEWQGDNLLLAREALLYTFIEYYIHKFHKPPKDDSVRYIAYIISWNLWQMDGLRMVVPDTCHDAVELDLFGFETVTPCPGCKTGNMTKHNGIACLVRDWNKASWNKKELAHTDLTSRPWVDPQSKPWQKMEFRSLFTQQEQSEAETENL